MGTDINMDKSAVIKGKKVNLRFITRDDAGLIVKWRNTEYVRKNFIYQKSFTIDEHMRWLDSMMKITREYGDLSLRRMQAFSYQEVVGFQNRMLERHIEYFLRRISSE